MVPRQGEEATPSDAERADDAAGVTQYETRYSALSGAEISRAGVRRSARPSPRSCALLSLPTRGALRRRDSLVVCSGQVSILASVSHPPRPSCGDCVLASSTSSPTPPL